MYNMKAPSLSAQKLHVWPRLNFFKSKSNVKVKVTGSENFGTNKKVLPQEI